jgi:hypothetical protein
MWASREVPPEYRRGVAQAEAVPTSSQIAARFVREKVGTTTAKNEPTASAESWRAPMAAVAAVRNFYKVEKWTRDGTKVDN